MNQVTLFLAVKGGSMRNFLQITASISVLAIFAASATAFTPAPSIVSISPSQNELNVPALTNISVTFDMDMDETTINNSTFVVNASLTGISQGMVTYDTLNKIATIDPVDNFVAGELVTVVLTIEIQSSQGVPLETSLIWQFSVVVAGGTGHFEHHSSYVVGDTARSVSVADLNNDGYLDLVTASWWSSNVAVLLNNGDSSFGPRVDYTVGDGPVSIVAADLEGDGDMDLVTANFESDNISFLANNGDGTFAPEVTYPSDIEPASVCAADLDGDGDLDLANTNADGTSSNISVRLNNGDGTFAPYTLYPVDRGPVSIIAGDLDNDGALDLVTANYHDYSLDVSVLLNNGDGTFGTRTDYTVGSGLNEGPFCVIAPDVDGDGDLDLVTANKFTSTVRVLPNNGDGTFDPYLPYAAGYRPSSILAADLDADGDLDFAAADLADAATVLLNAGDGSFVFLDGYTVEDKPVSIFGADIDNDGDVDLATVNWNSGDVSVLLNQEPICGDINGDWDGPNIADVTYLVDYLFFSGSSPPVMEVANVDGIGGINVADLTYLVDYLFFGGPEPVC